MTDAQMYAALYALEQIAERERRAAEAWPLAIELVEGAGRDFHDWSYLDDLDDPRNAYRMGCVRLG